MNRRRENRSIGWMGLGRGHRARPLEWLVEKLTFFISLTAILLVSLIFLFVAREAMPVFLGRMDSSALQRAIPVAEMDRLSPEDLRACLGLTPEEFASKGGETLRLLMEVRVEAQAEAPNDPDAALNTAAWRDIHAPDVDVIELRKRVGMVFQRSNPFPRSIHENVAYALRLQGMRERSAIDAVVERSLRAAALWDEVKDRLHASALGLSGGQQQRLCIARAIAIEPEVVLMDEPATALDPIATSRIEELIIELKNDFTIVIVTHNMQQAARISDITAFFYLGELIEVGPTSRLFTNPASRQTEDYVTGPFG